MEINISSFFREAAHRDYSASVAELGPDAGKVTWNHAMEDSAPGETLMLDTSAKVDALREHMRGFGAWDDDEIDNWTVQECNAMFLQAVSGDIRETPDMEPGNWDWELYEQMANEGTVGGRMFLGDDQEIYYYLGE